MNGSRTPFVGVVIGLLLPALAFAENLDSRFDGHAISSVSDAPGVYTVGESYAAYLKLAGTPSMGDPWYAWNQADFEYTMVVTSSVNEWTPESWGWSASFTTTTVSVYGDDKVSGTTADFADTGTFTDGTLLFSGSSTDMQAFGVTGSNNWVMTGSTRFTSGSATDDLACHPTSSLVLNGSCDTVLSSPPGYDERASFIWNCESGTVVTGLEGATWGRVKALYR